MLDKDEFLRVAESLGTGSEYVLFHWLEKDTVDALFTKYSGEDGTSISFDAFKELVWPPLVPTCSSHPAAGALEQDSMQEAMQANVLPVFSPDEPPHVCTQTADGVLLEGRLSEYRTLFEQCPSWQQDDTGFGTVDRSCIVSLSGRLEQPFTVYEAQQALEQFCDGTICDPEDARFTFAAFLNLFRDKMLDLQQIEEYMKLEAVPEPSFSENEVRSCFRKLPCRRNCGHCLKREGIQHDAGTTKVYNLTTNQHFIRTSSFGHSTSGQTVIQHDESLHLLVTLC